MIPAKVEEAFSCIAQGTRDAPGTIDAIVSLWEGGRANGPIAPDLLRAAREIERALPALTRTNSARDRLAPLLTDFRADMLLAWATASSARADVRLEPILTLALETASLSDRALDIARDRVVQGPLEDALAVAALLGDRLDFGKSENRELRARLEILLWEAGAAALSIPEFSMLLWRSSRVFDELIRKPSGSNLRGRVLAARCLELGARVVTSTVTHEALGKTLQVLQPLLLHPEPLVSTHAARALGLLAGHEQHLEAMLLDWLGSDSELLAKRGMTAAASLPGARVRALSVELSRAFARPESASWALAGAALATPYLMVEAKELWDEVYERILSGEGGASAARDLALGLHSVYRVEARQAKARAELKQLRQKARRARPQTIDEFRDWLRVFAYTDMVEGAERDPLDVEMGLENLVHLAAQFDDEEADARAGRFAESLGRTFEDAMRLVLRGTSKREQATGMNALEGAARTMALRLWDPQLATRPGTSILPPPDLGGTWEQIARAPHELLEVVVERRAAGELDAQIAEALEVLALRLGGYALDACGSESEGAPGGGPTAHATCRWLRKLSHDGQLAAHAKQEALSALFWRLVDTTRGTALGAVDDVEWLGPFAAWWALVIDRPVILTELGRALPMIRPEALERCTALAEALRTTVFSADSGAAWVDKAGQTLAELRATGTELALALDALGRTLLEVAATSGRDPELEPKCLKMVLSAERLQDALADPVRGLHPPKFMEEDLVVSHRQEQAPRTAALIARAIRSRELSVLEVWFTSLGPVASALTEAAVREARDRTPPPPPSRRKLEPETIEGYELVRPLGEGGVGKVWLVRKPGADRLFVLKIPKSEALANASDTEREGLLSAFVEEAKALAGLYHPNVANIIDRGVSKDVPFLVLELLIGADLQKYSRARLLSLFELRQIVLDSCAGLFALHGASLVHRDIKPANIWLRLPLEHGEKFEGVKHRDPAVTRPLSAVVIDFGMVRPTRVAADAGGRFVAGTPGYMAPDQVLDPMDLDPRADVYGLAATVYNVTTGRTFFDEIKNSRDRIIAHMQRDPFEDLSRLAEYPSALQKLMRQAVALDPKDRPWPLEFGHAFEASL